MAVLVSIPNTFQTIKNNNIDFNEMNKINDNMLNFYRLFHTLEEKNIFVLCNVGMDTYGYLDIDQLMEYPDSYITQLCNFELEHNDNRMIVLNCDDNALQAIVRFYVNGTWDMEYLRSANIDGVVPENCKNMQYKEQYIIDFLGLPSCYSEEEIHRYNSKTVGYKKKKKTNTQKNDKKRSLQERVVDSFLKDVPEEYLDLIDDEMISHIVENEVPNHDLSYDQEFDYESDCGYEDDFFYDDI